MKILQLGKFWSPHYGGIETIVELLSRGLANAGYDVQTIVAGRDCAVEELGDRLQLQTVKTWKDFFSQPISFLPSFHSLASKPDLVHLHLPNPLWAWKIAKWPVALVVTVHADLPKNSYKSGLNHFAQKSALLKAQAIVFTSEVNKLLLTSQWNDQLRSQLMAKCQVIAPATEVSASLPLSDQNFILFVGRWVSYKGLPLLLQACRGTNWRLVIAGNGPEKKKIEKLVRKFKMQGTCELVVSPNPQELERLYSTCSLVVLPSIDEREAFGLTLVEANLHKKPFVASRLSSGIQDILQGNGGLSFVPNDWRLLKEALQKLMSDPNLRKLLGETGNTYCLQRFTPRKMVQEYAALYTTIASRAKV